MKKIKTDSFWETWNPITIETTGSKERKSLISSEELKKPLSWSEQRIVEIPHDYFLNGIHVDYSDFEDIVTVIRACPQHIFLLSTTCPMAMDQYLALYAMRMKSEKDVTELCPNLWKGLLVETQQDFDMRRTYISYNPLFIEVLFLKNISTYINITEWLDYYDPYFFHNTEKNNPIKWIVIEGGEHPVHPGWIRDIIKFGKSYNIPVYFKGWGQWIPQEEQLSPSHAKVIYLNQNGVISQKDENIVNVVCLKNVGGDSNAGCLVNNKEFKELPVKKE